MNVVNAQAGGIAVRKIGPSVTASNRTNTTIVSDVPEDMLTEDDLNMLTEDDLNMLTE